MEPNGISAMLAVSDDALYNTMFASGLAYSAVALIGCLFFNAAYGKFADDRFGIELDSRFGWWLMELPATLSFHFFYWTGPNAFKPVPLLCMFLYSKHYANRGWFFPLSIRVAKGTKQSFSLTTVAVGMTFTALHGYLNARWFSAHGKHLESTSWLSSPWFLVGYPMYELAFWMTVHSEYIMRNLRDPKDTKGPRYKVPYGGGFEFVTNPQYFFELLGWFAWTLFSKNPAGVVVFLISSANLIPRAFNQHKWYLSKFENYPKHRKVLIPFLL